MSQNSASQDLRPEDPPRHPTAVALEWSTKITTVALEMCLPAVGGWYLDQMWGTRFWVLIGAVIGPPVGIWHLLRMTQQAQASLPNTKVTEASEYKSSRDQGSTPGWRQSQGGRGPTSREGSAERERSGETLADLPPANSDE